LPSGRFITISDTVGFVRHLPHQLVEAFKSTLEEVSNSNLIIHLVDGSDPDPKGQYDSVREVLQEIGADHIRELIVINKIDLIDDEKILSLKRLFKESLFISTKESSGITELLIEIDKRLPNPTKEINLLIPYSRGDILAKIHKEGKLISLIHEDSGTRVHAFVPADLFHIIENLDLIENK
jgi:GTP-binding protein HflX